MVNVVPRLAIVRSLQCPACGRLLPCGGGGCYGIAGGLIQAIGRAHLGALSGKSQVGVKGTHQLPVRHGRILSTMISCDVQPEAGVQRIGVQRMALGSGTVGKRGSVLAVKFYPCFAVV